ncbi:type II toxin-antitoxin system VapC family toxin [bacterium]|nr:MAG: type II toxin-antitoxin system VapC family toxin [bacterium]
MNILLDTHILIWWSDTPELLSSSARAFMEDRRNTLAISVVSIWEMQIKINLGKLSTRLPLREMVSSQIAINGIQILHLDLPHIFELSNLPHHHRDPFDRLLIAQARVENMPILTADVVFSSYDVSILG